jgi:hypothetical protein
MPRAFSFLLGLLLTAACGFSASAAPVDKSKNAAGDKITVVDKTFQGTGKGGPGSRKLGNIQITVDIEAVLKSRQTASLRAGATIGEKEELVTLFTRPIKEGPVTLQIPLTVVDPKVKSLIIVVWIDENPTGSPSPLKPLVFEKFGFDLTSF